MGRLNRGGLAYVLSVSCGSASACVAGGYYSNAGDRTVPFLVSRTGGAWGTAKQVPGLAALNRGYAAIQSVSCAAPSACVAGGSYGDRSGKAQAFVVSGRNGAWGRAMAVPGLAALNRGGAADIESLACPSAGNCAALGSYRPSPTRNQVYVVNERHGRWAKARPLPGFAALNKGGYVGTVSVSCASAGNCAAGGQYEDSSGFLHGFVVTERNGAWGMAQKVPGLAALSPAGDDRITSVSCAPRGGLHGGGVLRRQL